MHSVKIGRTWNFDPTSLVRMRVWNGSSVDLIDHTGFTFSTPTESGDVVTIQASYAADADLVATLTVTKEERGFEFGLSIPEGHSTAIMDFEWPRFNVIPPGDMSECFAYSGLYGGYVTYRPQDDTTQIFVARCPQDIPVTALWDAETKAIFYMMSDDEEGNRLEGRRIGMTDSVLYYWTHYFDRRYVVGKAFSKTYKIHLEGFEGLSPVPEFCADDVARRFSQWATDSKRKWITLPWKDRADISSRVKDSNIFWIGGTVQDEQREDLLTIKTHLASGGTPVESFLFGYHSGVATGWPNTDLSTVGPNAFGHPPTALDPAKLTSLDTIQAANIHAYIYTIPYKWANTGLGGTAFDPNNFEVTTQDPFTGAISTVIYNDLRAYSMKDQNGSTKTADGLFTFDYTLPEVQTIILEVLERYVVAFTGTKPRGIYLDTFPGELDHLEFQDDPSRTEWTWAAYMQGQKDAIDFWRIALRRLYDDEMIFSTESNWFEMIPHVDYVFNLRSSSAFVSSPARTFLRTFSRYCRQIDFAIPALRASFLGFNKALYPLIQATTMEFMHSGFISLSSIYDVATNMVQTPIDGSHVYDPFWDWMKALHEAMPRLRKYFEGWILRDAGGNSNELRRQLIRQREFDDIFWMVYNGGAFHTQSIVRKADDGDIGVILFNTWKNGVELAWHPDPDNAAQEVTVSLDSNIHELPVGKKNLYSVNVASGARTLITSFTHSVEVTRTLPPFSVNLLEVSLT